MISRSVIFYFCLSFLFLTLIEVQLTNQPIDRAETEGRIAILRKIGNEQQTGESLVHAAIGRSDSVLAGTSQNGKHAVQLQIQSLQDIWQTLVNSLRHGEERLSLALQQWSLWEDAVSASESWLNKV